MLTSKWCVQAGNICQNRAAITVWPDSMKHWLERLLSPRTIAIVGASERDGSIAANTHRQLRERGFGGRIYSVNPRYPSLHGDVCHATLAALPEVPDLVLYAISGLPLEQSFTEAVALGVGGVLIYAANHVDGDTDPPLTERLRQQAAAAGIPVCGGNSMGFYNYDRDIMVSFDRPPPQRPRGHIGLISHSGSGMTYLANNDTRFCFNYVIASGQEIHASVGHYIDYLLQQESTRVIAILLEAVRDVPAFTAALERAGERSIPVVITRLGRTAKSAQLARSHSGAIVGDQAAFAALCRRHGAILCRDADEMMVTAMLFAAGLRVTEGKLASMLDSGGMREQMIDLADEIGVEFADVSPVTVAVMRAHLEAGLEAINPMDGMGALGRNSLQTFLACGRALLDDVQTGLLSFEFEFRDGFSHYPELFDVTRQLAAHNDKPVVLINSCAFATLDETAARLTGDGIPVINGIDVALRGLRNLMYYRPAKALAVSPPRTAAGGREFRLATGVENRCRGHCAQDRTGRCQGRHRQCRRTRGGLPRYLRAPRSAGSRDADGRRRRRGGAGDEKRSAVRAAGDRRLRRSADRAARRAGAAAGAGRCRRGGGDDRRNPSRVPAGRRARPGAGRSLRAGGSAGAFLGAGARVRGLHRRDRSQPGNRQPRRLPHRRCAGSA
jgi:acyl-CoA synthetase (NDP forming)